MWRRTDVVETVLLLIVGVGVVVESFRLGIGTPLTPLPGFFPLAGGSLLILLASIFLAQAGLRRGAASQAPAESFGELRRPAILVVSMAIYTALLDPVGYVLPTIVLTALILRILGVTSWKALGLTSVGLSAGTYLLFGRVLGIDLPAGILSFLG